jgi:hypothetical protein
MITVKLVMPARINGVDYLAGDVVSVLDDEVAEKLIEDALAIAERYYSEASEQRAKRFSEMRSKHPWLYPSACQRAMRGEPPREYLSAQPGQRQDRQSIRSGHSTFTLPVDGKRFESRG